MSPFEAATGVPLTLWAPGDGKPTRHHAHFFKAEYEKGPRDKRGFLRAVRFSRLQMVNQGPHTRYHKEYEGTLYPNDRHAGFVITLLNKSGYVTPFVVDMSRRRSRIVETTPAMREELRRPGVITMERSPYRRRELGRFLMYYAIQQKFTPEDLNLVEEFISLKGPSIQEDPAAKAHREALGLQLVDLAIMHAVDPIESRFKEAREAHLLREGTSPSAFEEVKTFVAGHESDYYDALQQHLTRQLAA